jgi:hypothetical protein
MPDAILSDEVFSAIRNQLSMPADARITEAVLRMRPGRPALLEVKIVGGKKLANNASWIISKYELVPALKEE